jgi:hypothetical protein
MPDKPRLACVDIVCTGCGTHKRRLLDRLWWVRGEDGRMTVASAGTSMGRFHEVERTFWLNDEPEPGRVREGRETPTTLDGCVPQPQTTTYRCPSCGIEERWKPSRVARIVKGCVSQGITEFDLSRARNV